MELPFWVANGVHPFHQFHKMKYIHCPKTEDQQSKVELTPFSSQTISHKMACETAVSKKSAFLTMQMFIKEKSQTLKMKEQPVL